MKETFANGWRSFRLLADSDQYTRKEKVLKYGLLPFLFLTNAVLFVVIASFYLIERLFAFVFRFFISLQAKLYRKRMFIKENLRVYFTLLSVVLFILFLPFILIYYVSMGIKSLGKRLMRAMIVKMDLSNHFKPGEVYVFDDVSIHTKQKVSGMMKDLNQTAELGSAFETIMNQPSSSRNSSDERR